MAAVNGPRVAYHSEKTVAIIGRNGRHRFVGREERRHVEHLGKRHQRRDLIRPLQVRQEPLEMEGDDYRQRFYRQLLRRLLIRLALATHNCRVRMQMFHSGETFQTVDE